MTAPVAEPHVIEGTNIVDPRSSAFAVTVAERMGEVTIRKWCVRPRTVVEADTVVVVVEDQYGEIEVTAREAGVVAAVMHPEGTRLSPHAVLCYIRLKAPPPVPVSAPPRLVHQLQSKGSGESAGAVTAVPPSRGRDAVNEIPAAEPPAAKKEEVLAVPEVEELYLPLRRKADTLDADVPVVAAAPRAMTTREERDKTEPNTIGKKYRITPSQDRRLTDIVARLNRAKELRDEVRRHKVRDSEVVRALLEWYETQSVEVQATLIRDNRVLERAERYGIGWPRPPRAGGLG
jgi:pyruvate/2-oxoglutarate dehydrogenase complex dihydrolipoamide acyltransferase (E2) component